MKDLLGELPKRLEEEKGERPWGIDFSQDRPMWVEFADSSIRFGIRARRFVQGDETHPGMAVVVTYRVEPTGDGITFLREEEFDITPLDFADRQEQRFSAQGDDRQDTDLPAPLSRSCSKRDWSPNRSPSKANGKKAGPLVLKRLEAKDGWLVGEYDK